MSEVTISPTGRPLRKSTVSLPAAAIGAGAQSVITASMPGVNVGDQVLVSQRVQLDTGLVVSSAGCYVAGTVSVTVFNPTAAPITPAAIRVMSVTVVPFNPTSF